MKTGIHRIYIAALVLILVAVTFWLGYRGYSYYGTSMEERFYHDDYQLLKPNGFLGHGLGIFGSLSMILGVSLYMLRKRVRVFQRLGLIRHWLEFHIFLCVLGPVLVLFHTSFKVGGLVAVSFWSMVAVVLSGVAGRYIYIRIPRTIEGRELSLVEIRNLKNDLNESLSATHGLDRESLKDIVEATEKYFHTRKGIRLTRKFIRKRGVRRRERRRIIRLVRREISLNRRIDRLQLMQNLFRYWHVAHLPFALIMLVIMLVHVLVSIVFGYTWVF
ncbi:MAG: hypothetical protein P1P86_11805 [Bacteroidales bacterium]|nr:hypothetical protein [Bacteroidales bacterium]